MKDKIESLKSTALILIGLTASEEKTSTKTVSQLTNLRAIRTERERPPILLKEATAMERAKLQTSSSTLQREVADWFKKTLNHLLKPSQQSKRLQVNNANQTLKELSVIAREPSLS
jgi:hypothetical protein